ncbi:MAG: hypothetical protein Q9226_006064 [Calogaya cf. arnoldii]
MSFLPPTTKYQVSMPALGDVRVAISVDKQTRTDYDDADTDDQHAKYISRYVECKSGAMFSVAIQIKKTMHFKSDAIIFRVYVDGHYADSHVVAQAIVSSNPGPIFFRCAPGASKKVGDQWEFRPFMFGEIEHVDQPSGLVANKPDRKKLGSIVVEFHHVTQKHDITVKESSWDETKIPSQAIALSETELKGSSATHTASYGKKQPTAAREMMKVDYIDGKNSPFARIQFKYRSKSKVESDSCEDDYTGTKASTEALQSMLLIPRTPSPPPPPRLIPLEERPVETLSVEELQQLVHRLRVSTPLIAIAIENSVDLQKESRTVEPQTKSKLESTLAEQNIKSEQEVKPETGVKRERDEEVDEILASAYTKNAKPATAVDLTDL